MNRQFGPVASRVCLGFLVLAGAASVAGAGTDCLGDFNADGLVNTQDFVGFLNAWSADAPSADYHQDGTIDTRDIVAFLNAFAGGCEQPDFAGDPNPNDPGEQGFALPGGPSSCAGSPSMATAAAGWAHGVFPFSGELHQEAVDLRVRGRSLDFIWARRYRSQGGPDTAQGARWDFSYNIYLEKHGPHLNVHNGFGRSDTYRSDGPDRWTRTEYFRTLTRNPDGSYTLKFADTGTWSFHAFDGSAADGKLAAIADRNGNAMGFEYDGEGRLSFVTDDLGYPYTISYNAEGLIDAVCDGTGRCVTYEYYQDGDADGAAGDLESVTSPPVTGTPTGNDFPLGKTTRYTYTTGAQDENLNHLLLSITDPKGQVYYRVTYNCGPGAPPSKDLETGDPGDSPGFQAFQVPPPLSSRSTCGYVQRIEWGEPGDIVDLTYYPVVPDQSNNFASVQTIVNDRLGHVKELFSDSLNRGVMSREFTGLADPDRPTTPTSNRPTGKLRPSDPDFFETRWTHNADGLVTEVVYPNLNSTLMVYDEGNDSRRSRGNMLERRYLPGPLGGDQNELLETFEYDEDFGGCGCGPQFVIRHVDFRGNATTHTYDDFGNRTHTTHRIPSIVEDWEYNAFGQVTAHILPDNGSNHRRRDEFRYYDENDGDQNGRLRESVVDATGHALTSTYAYDAVGNLVTTIDPGGHDSHTIYNQLDQAVRTISAEVTPGGGVRYERDTYYDANNNIVRVDVQNRDDQGAIQPNTHYTTVFEYDALNRLRCDCAESGEYTGDIPGPPELPTCTGLPDADFVRHEYAYDANGNPTLTRFGEAVEGRQPANHVTTLYDERDKVFRVVRAQDHADQSTTQYDYDANGNPNALTQGLEAAADPKYSGDAPRVSVSKYDGYNRLAIAIDPMGNVAHSVYDPNGNTVATLTQGELDDVEGSAGNIRLHETTLTYDAMDRLTRTDVAFFDTATQAPILVGATPDGLATTETAWTDSSQVRLVRDDNLHETVTLYDTANRVASVTDAKGNRVEYTYDDDSLVVETLETDLSDLGNPAEEYLTLAAYDGLHRRVSTVDNVGNVTTALYDSRSNRTRAIDARANETRHAYDGLGRLVATTRDLDGDGADGDGPDITTTQAWDDTSRLVGQGDDNGNVTVTVYDPLGRRTAEEYADCTSTRFDYDSHDNAFRTTDGNGSVALAAFDLLDRRTRVDVTPGAGVSDDTTLEEFAYDGLSRQVLARDDDSEVTRAHDSLSHITGELLTIDRGGAAETTGATACLYDGVGNQLRCVYPGGRTIDTTYDALDRKSEIADQSGQIAAYDYIGRGRVERREYGNGTRTDYSYDGIANDPGDFGVRRIVRTLHTRASDGAILDDRTFTWDRVQNKTERADIRAGGPGLTHAYTYDDADRLVHTTVTNSGGNVICERDYSLDGVGNRTAVSGCTDPGAYTLDPALCEPGDLQMNQYTATSFDTRAYDANGNLVTIDAGLSGERRIAYDYRNRMVEYLDLGAGERHLYRYDPLGRRIRRVVDADGGGGSPEETRYFFHAWQVNEEQSSAGATLATYAYGLYIDEALTMRRAGADFYYHADDNYNVMALSDSAGNVVERYEHLDYGQPADPFTDAAIDGFASAVGNPYLFTGRRLDSETGWYEYRTRYLDPRGGRFTARDIIGVWGDVANLGNGLAYGASAPSVGVDPFGLYKTQAECEEYEGAGNCGYCPIGLGDPGWHRQGGCDAAAVMARGGPISFVEPSGSGSGGGGFWGGYDDFQFGTAPGGGGFWGGEDFPWGIAPGGGGNFGGWDDFNWGTAPGGGGIFGGDDWNWGTAPGGGGFGRGEIPGELAYPRTRLGCWLRGGEWDGLCYGVWNRSIAPNLGGGGSGGGGFFGGDDWNWGTAPGGGGSFGGWDDFHFMRTRGSGGSGGGGFFGGEDMPGI